MDYLEDMFADVWRTVVKGVFAFPQFSSQGWQPLNSWSFLDLCPSIFPGLVHSRMQRILLPPLQWSGVYCGASVPTHDNMFINGSITTGLDTILPLGYGSLHIQTKMTQHSIKFSDVFPLNEHPSFPLTSLYYQTPLGQAVLLLRAHLRRFSLHVHEGLWSLN